MFLSYRKVDVSSTELNYIPKTSYSSPGQSLRWHSSSCVPLSSHGFPLYSGTGLVQCLERARSPSPQVTLIVVNVVVSTQSTVCKECNVPTFKMEEPPKTPSVSGVPLRLTGQGGPLPSRWLQVQTPALAKPFHVWINFWCVLLHTDIMLKC